MIQSVSQAFDRMIEQQLQKEHIRNRKTFLSSASARKFRYLRTSLNRFSENILLKDFGTLTFAEIDGRFLQQYVDHLQGINVNEKLRRLKQVFRSAGVNTGIFRSVEITSGERSKITPCVSYPEVVKIRDMDRTELSDRERLYLDLFLFGFYSGGSTIAELAALRKTDIRDNDLHCKRIGFSKTAQIPMNEYTRAIVKRYRGKCYDDYLLPIFTQKHNTAEQQQGRIKRVSEQTNRILKNVCRKLNLNCEITLNMSRGIFIRHLIAHRMPFETIAAIVGCSIETIIRYYEKMK